MSQDAVTLTVLYQELAHTLNKVETMLVNAPMPIPARRLAIRATDQIHNGLNSLLDGIERMDPDTVERLLQEAHQ